MIKIKNQELIAALEDSSGFQESFLNLKTGKIYPIISEFLPVQEEIKDDIEQNPDNYIEIIPIYSSESYQIMVNFAEQLNNNKVKNHLFKSLNQKSPFRGFKDVLLNYPDIRDQWFEFKDNESIKIAKKWLEKYEITAELI